MDGLLNWSLCFINCVIWCVAMWLTVLLKTEIAKHIHSFVFHNEQKNQDISPSSADYYWTTTIAPSNKPRFTHVSQYL